MTKSLSEVADLQREMPVGTEFWVDTCIWPTGKIVHRHFKVIEHTKDGLILAPLDGRREVPINFKY